MGKKCFLGVPPFGDGHAMLEGYAIIRIWNQSVRFRVFDLEKNQKIDIWKY